MNKKPELNLIEIGRRLKAVRIILGLSIEKISESTGFSKSLISEAENGYKKPSAIYLYGLLDLFGVNINYILKGDGVMFLTGGFSEVGEDEEVKEMLYYMENIKMVRYSVLANFIDFKTRHKGVIQDLLNEAVDRKKKKGNKE